MFKKKIDKGLYMLSMNVEDMLFESMWALPHGVSMNSYIVKGEKVAIIDGVIGWDGVVETLYEELHEIDINPKDIEYLVVNHLEPDHAGWIDKFRKVNDSVTIVTTAKGKPILEAFYGDNLDIMVVGEGDTLDLGQGKKLSFHPIPNVHWPETMFTYEESSKILFSCDMYGGFGVMNDHHFDDEMTEEETKMFTEESARYYSNVLMTFSPMVKRAILKSKELDVSMIAPGHGPVHRGHVDRIMDEYERYTNYANGPAKKEVAIVWGSMYGTTGDVVEHVKKQIEDAGITVHSLHMPYTSDSEMVSKVFQSSAVIVAASTYEYKMFPPVAHAIDELGRKKMTGKQGFFFGSYGWNPGAQKDFLKIIENYRMKWTLIDGVEFKGIAKEEDYHLIDDGVRQLIEKINS